MTTSPATAALDPTLCGVLDGFDAAAITWVVLRGRAQLAAPGHDVDLLVARADLDRAEDVVFGLGGVALPRRLHPWHRMYVVGPTVKLDVVTGLTYNRNLRLHSGLESGVLQRRTHDNCVYVPDPTDLFWTVLLHCMLDKQAFSSRRQLELRASLPSLRPGSAGESYLRELSHDAISTKEVIRRVRASDWAWLVALGRDILERTQPSREGMAPSLATAHPMPPEPESRGQGVRAVLQRALAAVYPQLWRRIGLGATPHAAAVAENAGVDVLITEVIRRPLMCETAILVEDSRRRSLEEALRRDGFLRARRAWYRLVATGFERAVVASPGLDGEVSWAQLRAAARPTAQPDVGATAVHRSRHVRRIDTRIALLGEGENP